jgi:PAS domain S-box-containing protein
MSETISYEKIFHATSNGVVVTDATGVILDLNRQAEAILGFKTAEHTGRYISDLLPLTGPLVMECLRTGKSRLGHHILGKEVDLVLNITPVRSNRKILGAVCNFQEMREFENAAKKLASYKRVNKQLETIFNASSDGIWVCNGEGRVIDVNAASEALNGIQARDVVGRNMADLIAEGLFDQSVTLEVLETRRQVSVMQYVKRTGRYLLATGTPVLEEDGRIFLVVTNERDMTQLNAIRQELDRTHMITEKMREELADLSLRELKEQQIVADSEKMRQIVQVALKLARMAASNILILGESGTGKGLLAKFIHDNSQRRKNPFIQINCAALPENLLEAELFGYEKGAFTGASEKGKVGLFELAHEGTLFLDEIGDLPLPLQAKLLKYLDDREVIRLGGTRAKRIDCSIIAATNQNLEDRVAKKMFRQDLYYRLNTFRLRIPPLRERPEDIFELVRFFLHRYNKAFRTKKQIQQAGMEAILAHPFPGNVRELKNLIKQAVVISDERKLDPHIQSSLQPLNPLSLPASSAKRPKNLSAEVSAVEESLLREACRRCRTTREVATRLGVSQSTVVRKMRRYGLRFR